jgi:hypothetical protein
VTDDNVTPIQQDRYAGVPPTDPRRRQLRDLMAGNRAGLERLRLDNVALKDTSKMRLELLIDLALPPDDRLTFEVAYQEQVRASIEQMQSQVARAKLTAPGPAPHPAGGKLIPRG